MSSIEGHPRFRGGRVIQVVRVEILEGQGTQTSPARLVTYYLSLEGEVLAVTDSHPSAKEDG